MSLAVVAWADDGERERGGEEELLKHTGSLPHLWNLTPLVQITALPRVLMTLVIFLSVFQLPNCIKWQIIMRFKW